MYPFDLPTEEFDPQSLEHCLLVLSFVGMTIYGFWVVGKEENRPTRPTHRYNRDTGTVEPIDDESSR